jgi:hypothetical protein
MSRKSQLLAAVATLKGKAQGGIPKVDGVSLTDRTLYIAVPIKGQGGTIDVVDSNTKREVGVTNLDGNKLNAGRDYVIDGVRVLIDNSNSATLSSAAWSFSNIDSFPVAFQNAELVIEQDGNVLVDMPMTDLADGNGYEKFREISTMPLIRSNLEFTIKIVYAKGVSVSSAKDTNIRFEFRAHQAKR